MDACTKLHPDQSWQSTCTVTNASSCYDPLLRVVRWLFAKETRTPAFNMRECRALGSLLNPLERSLSSNATAEGQNLLWQLVWHSGNMEGA